MLELNLGDGPFDLVFDPKQLKPGCALIQALGGTLGIANAFNPEVWLIDPTPEMQRYRITKEQLVELVALVHDTHLKKKEAQK